MSNRLTNIIATSILVLVFFVTVFSMKDDSLTMDELAHLPAGFAYFTKKDMRLNLEHPPLMKDLAAVPLLFIKGINFPSEIKDWKEDVNGQWSFGNYFLFKVGNPAELMIFLARIPMILILLLLGLYIFKWTRELFGNKAALLALFLFSFSPTFLAHGRLVTTDVGAAAGVLIATYYFLRALKEPSKKNIILAGVSFGIAELCKFTVIILIPFFIFISLIWWLIRARKFWQTFKILILVFVIGYILVWTIYLYHVWNYPLEKQISDIKELHKNRPIPVLTETLAKLSKIPLLGKPIKYLISEWKGAFYLTDLPTVLTKMAENPILRPYSHYLNGLCLVIQRGLGGHTTFFLGEVSATGWRKYFPIVYLIKEPLTLHILTLIALLYTCWSIKKPFWVNTFSRVKAWIKNHFAEFAMLCFIVIYWTFSLISNLNIGVRHLLPAFPFTFILISAAIVSWLRNSLSKLKYVFLFFLLLWQAVSVISIFPHFLAYANEIVGGPGNLYLYTVNSNLDWGQDLKRLKKWVDEEKIERIYIDYFGGANTQYYLKEKYAPWWGTRDSREFKKGNYLAVSATLLEGGRGEPVSGFTQAALFYRWLALYEPPLKKIGYSIFVYYIE